MNLTLRHIELLEAIVRNGTFLRAAEELNISQPALSRAVAAIEDHLGVRLLDRTTKSVVPTRSCEYLIAHGMVLVQEMFFLHRDIDMMRGAEAGKIMVGAGPVVAQTFLGKAVGQFCRDFPRISILMSVAE